MYIKLKASLFITMKILQASVLSLFVLCSFFVSQASLSSGYPRQENQETSLNFPSPSETGKKIVANVVGRRFGWRYQKVCTYYGCLIFAEASGDKSIPEQIMKGYTPFLKGTRKPHIGHMDYNVFGIWPFEMYRQTGKEEYLKIPKNLADKEFRTLQPDGLTSLEAKNKL